MESRNSKTIVNILNYETRYRFMLVYRGISKISEWDMNDIDQVLRGLVLSQMSYAQHKSHLSSLNYNYHDDTTTHDEWEIYKMGIDVIYHFLKELKEMKVEEFGNPPIVFVVKKKTIYLYPCLDGDNFPTLHPELVDEIVKKIQSCGKDYKVEICKEELKNDEI